MVSVEVVKRTERFLFLSAEISRANLPGQTSEHFITMCYLGFQLIQSSRTRAPKNLLWEQGKR